MKHTCIQCGAAVSADFKFCNACGAPVEIDTDALPTSTEPYSDLLKGRALRILTGEKAGTFYSVSSRSTIGRSQAEIQIHDSYASPIHANLENTPGGLSITDRNSLNGILLQIQDSAYLHDHDLIRAGDHYFMYEVILPEHFDEGNGIEFYATPHHNEHFRLIEIIKGGLRGRACVASSSITVGRSQGEFIFKDDMKMSPKHFSIEWTPKGAMIIDHHSCNGTFLQVHRIKNLKPGTLFFIGNTLFQFII